MRNIGVATKIKKTVCLITSSSELNYSNSHVAGPPIFDQVLVLVLVAADVADDVVRR